MSELINKILTEAQLLTEDKIVGFQNPNYGNFVVMMGSPGAGKTMIAKNFLNLNGYKHLAGDNWLELVAKKQGLDLKNSDVTHDLNTKYEDKFKTFRYNFIKQQLTSTEPANIVVDITGKSVQSVKKALDVVENSHYVTTLVYVITSKEECIKRNLQRARKVPEEFLMAVYDEIHQTYKAVFNLFDNVYEVINDDVWNFINSQGKFVRPSNRIRRVNESVERQGDYTIYCDLDGVLADFSGGYAKLTGKATPNTHLSGKDWKVVDDKKGFWKDLDWTSDGQALWNYISKYRPNILTSPSTSLTAKEEKAIWVQRLKGMRDLIFCRKSLKHNYAKPNNILIDDYRATIDRWRNAGGVGILHKNAADTIKQLKALGM